MCIPWMQHVILKSNTVLQAVRHVASLVIGSLRFIVNVDMHFRRWGGLAT